MVSADASLREKSVVDGIVRCAGGKDETLVGENGRQYGDMIQC